MKSYIKAFLIVASISMPNSAMAQCISCGGADAIAYVNQSAQYQQGIQIETYHETGTVDSTTTTTTKDDNKNQHTDQDTKTKTDSNYTLDAKSETMFGTAQMDQTAGASMMSSGGNLAATAAAQGNQSLCQSQEYTFANGNGHGSQSYSASQTSSTTVSTK